METKGKQLKRLTVEQVRKFKGFEMRTDQEIRQIILAVEKLSILIFKKLTKHKTYEQAP